MKYPYHNRLKQLLRQNKYYISEEKKTWVYRFHFPELGKSYPIRDYRVDEYKEFIKEGLIISD